MSILDELLEIASQEDRVNKAIEYVQNGYSITSNELNLIDSEKDRTKILSLYMLNNGVLDNRILSGISDEQNREEIILAWLKNQGEVRKKVKYNQELGYIIKYGLVYLDVITMQKTQESIAKIISAMIDNNIYTSDSTMLKQYMLYLDLVEDENVKSQLQEKMEAKFKDVCLELIQDNKMYGISKDAIENMKNDEHKKEIIVALGEKNRIIDTYSILGIQDLDIRESAIEELINKGNGISTSILFAVRKENRAKMLNLQIEKHHGKIDANMIEYIENEKERKQVLENYIKAGNMIEDHFLFETIENQEDLLDVLKLYAQGEYDVEEYWVTLLESTEKRLEYIEHCIRVGASVGQETLSFFGSQKDRMYILEKYIEIRGELDTSLFKSIDSQETISQIITKFVKHKNIPNNRHEKMLSTLTKINTMIENAKDEIRKETLLNQREMILTYINKISSNTYINPELYDEEVEEAYSRVMTWGEKGIIPDELIFTKVPSDKIEKFDFKIWNNLVKSVNKKLNDEEKGALVEIAYVFGIFDKDLKTARGIAKTDDDMIDEEKMQASAWENYEARKNKVTKFINSLESIEQLHEMFDGMKMDFNPKFYHFFFMNLDKIKQNVELSEGIQVPDGISIGTIQYELKDINDNIDKIENLYRTGTPTLDQCINYLIQMKQEIANRKYEKIDEGNTEIARLCALCGCSQEKFEKYQKLYNTSKERKTSSIPRIKAVRKKEIIDTVQNMIVTVEKNRKGNDTLNIEYEDKKIGFEIAKMDKPSATVIGEKIYSKCCQSIGEQGESCNIHSQESKNGGILEIRSEDGTFLGQSWCWVNGNVLCFDSAELKALDENKNMSDKDKEKYLSMIKIGYEQMAKRMLEESSKKIEEHIKYEKMKIQYDKDTSEYKYAEKKIEEMGENIKLKQVTIGKGFWTISKKLSQMYEEDGKKIEDTRQLGILASPIENVGYLNDSEVQYELARAEDVKDKDIKHYMTENKQEQLFTDKRNIIRGQGNIHRDVIAKIKTIEQKAHKKNMQMMQDIETVYEIDSENSLAKIYNSDSQNLKVICGEDWYYIYSENENNIVIHDAARAPEARIEGEENISQAEVVEAFYEIMEEAANAGKPIKAQLREDTSYAIYLKMLEKGQLEQIGEERIYDFKTGDEVEYTDEEKEELYAKLKDNEQRQKMAEKEDTTMHEIECNVTKKGKDMIKRMKDRYERD